MSKSTELAKTTGKGSIDGFLKQLNVHVFSRSNCKLCKSKYREEAEEQFAKVNNIRQIHNLLEKDKGMDISYKAVRNHLLRHYVGEDRLEGLKDYGAELDVWVKRGVSRKNSIIERITMLEREMIALAAISADESLDEKRRTADVMKKLSDGISSLEEKLAGIEHQQAPVEIIIDKLRDVVSVKMASIRSDEARQVLLDVIDELQQEVSDLVVEDK